MIVTTTPNIEGKRITKYLDIVSGSHYYNLGGLVGEGLLKQDKYYSAGFIQARQKMQQRAEELGADAIVGVHTEVLSAGNQYNVIIAVMGTAVKIEGGVEELDANPPQSTVPARTSSKMDDLIENPTAYRSPSVSPRPNAGNQNCGTNE